MPAQQFEDRVAIVTGASSGIGRSTAEMLVERGARVAVFARSAGKLKALAKKYDDRMLAVAGDVSDPDSVERLFSETEARFGKCDILINDAGTYVTKRIEKMSDRDWDRVFAVNVRGAFLTTRRAVKSMIPRRSGTIVNVSSISGVPGPEKFPGFSAYCASKAALIGFSEQLATELREHSIRVNCVSPGSVDTAMWAAVSGGSPADMTPPEVAEVILFLASERSRPINGQNIHVYSA
ncbi:MAG TPA: SDR family oxidoreductase [Thermoanaerobaculia bacterium]|nr:SDR family oxidoreductase [Thermoanaerobaculia bacterium]